MSLQTIAQKMRQQWHTHRQPIRFPLERGLRLTLWRDGEDWVLSLTRYGVAPSANEVKACRTAFDIPAGSQAETGQSENWQIIRLRWHDVPRQATLLEPPPAPPTHHYRGDL